ncbi:hypothetical protein [Streptomyces sp. NPDC020996]|uniref:hypothetical protein n=1 Tax=Streptomyces sp. NPDC020996 TaxID=3154791 RepID=UPI00340008C9
MSITTTASAEPTIVFGHGAFAESSNGNGVITALLDGGGEGRGTSPATPERTRCTRRPISTRYDRKEAQSCAQ